MAGIIPLDFQIWRVHGMDQFVLATRIVSYGGLALLTIMTSACALCLKADEIAQYLGNLTNADGCRTDCATDPYVRPAGMEHAGRT